MRARLHWPLKLDSHGGDVSIKDRPVWLDLLPGLQLLLGLLTELLQAQCLAATHGHAASQEGVASARRRHTNTFVYLGISAVTRRPTTWFRRGSAPLAPACPAETPPCPAASDTGSTWHWGRGSRTGWPSARRILGENQRNISKSKINKSKSQLLHRFRHSHIWGSPPSPSPQEAAPPRWTQRRSTLRHAPAWQMRRLSPSWRSQCRRGSLPVPVSPRCRRHTEARHIQKRLLLEHGPRWVPQLRPAAAVLKTILKGLVITLWDELEETFN